jgi:hypothetical protein
MIAQPNRFKNIWAYEDFEKIQNGGDMADGTEVFFFGFLAINPVGFGGFSTLALNWTNGFNL